MLTQGSSRESDIGSSNAGSPPARSEPATIFPDAMPNERPLMPKVVCPDALGTNKLHSQGHECRFISSRETAS